MLPNLWKQSQPLLVSDRDEKDLRLMKRESSAIKEKKQGSKRKDSPTKSYPTLVSKRQDTSHVCT
jgi:hypothetical protein